MIFDGIKILFNALSFGFDTADSIFDKIGFDWIAAVTFMVLVSLALRLFTAPFIGGAIRVEHDARVARKAEKQAKQSAAFAKKVNDFYGKKVL